MIAIAILMLVLVLVIGSKLSMNMAGKMLGRLVSDRNHDAECIVNTGKVPEMWIRQAEQRDLLSHLGIGDMQIRSKQKLLKRLEELIRYFQKCPYVQGDAKTILLEELHLAAQGWEAKPWTELTAGR